MSLKEENFYDISDVICWFSQVFRLFLLFRLSDSSVLLVMYGIKHLFSLDEVICGTIRP